MKEDSKNVKRRKLINLIKNYEVSPDAISVCIKISKVDINIVFKRLKSKLVLNIKSLILHLFFERNNKNYIYFLRDI